jgi:hypothetical protein
VALLGLDVGPSVVVVAGARRPNGALAGGLLPCVSTTRRERASLPLDLDARALPVTARSSS